MGQGHGLGALQVGVTGHHALEVLLRHFAQRADQILRQSDGLVDLVGEVHAQIQRHLIVAAAGGVQALARVADALRQLALHEGVDVLAGHVDLKRAGLDLGEDVRKARNDLLRVLRRDDILLAQHPRVGDGAGDVLFVHSGIKADGGVELVQLLVHLALQSACPKFHREFLL